MDVIELIAIYIAAMLVHLALVVYIWPRRAVFGGNAYLAWNTGFLLWNILLIAEILSPNLELKILWDALQWVITIAQAIFMPWFAIQYSQIAFFRNRIWGPIILAGPILFIAVLVLDPFLHTVYVDPHLITNNSIVELGYTFTFFAYAFGAYSYLVTLACFSILLRNFVRSPRVYRIQTLLVVTGVAFPVLGSIFALLEVPILPIRDVIPFFSAVGSLFIAIGLRRFGLFDLAPIAREMVLENLQDIIIVTDNEARIVDLNPAARRRMELGFDHDVIGMRMVEAIPDLTYTYRATKAKAGAKTITGIYAGETVHYEIKETPIRDYRGRRIGDVYVARDISAQVALQNELVELNNSLEERIALRTQELQDAYDTTLEGWAKALEYRDKETEGHSRRVLTLALAMADRLGIDDEARTRIRRGAILHDIGKMAIPDAILGKPGPLDTEERLRVNTHPLVARDLLAGIQFLQDCLEIPIYHHERWDGTGYPFGLSGEQIPLSARLFALVDVWDALCSDRPYSSAKPPHIAAGYFREQIGKHFDPQLVPVFLELVGQPLEQAVSQRDTQQ